MPSSARLLLALVCSLFACDQAGDTGAPCETKDDCDEGLICDEHDGRGSCQEPHGHDDDGGDEDGENEGEGGPAGTPCESDEDCEDSLECDDHDGAATCQEPHEHDTGEG